jgi:hypothetical protein
MRPDTKQAVFRSRDILIRIRILRSVHLINGSGSRSGCCSFREWLSRCQKKIFFSSIFECLLLSADGTVTFFIQTFFIRDKVYTNFLYTGQSLYGTKFIQDKVYTGTKFIRGQSLYGDKVYTGQSSYSDKVYTGTKFIQTFFILHT